MWGQIENDKAVVRDRELSRTIADLLSTPAIGQTRMGHDQKFKKQALHKVPVHHSQLYSLSPPLR